MDNSFILELPASNLKPQLNKLRLELWNNYLVNQQSFPYPISKLLEDTGASSTSDDATSILKERGSFIIKKSAVLNIGQSVDAPFSFFVNNKKIDIIINFPNEIKGLVTFDENQIDVVIQSKIIVVFKNLPKENGDEIPISNRQELIRINISIDSLIFELLGSEMLNEKFIVKLNFNKSGKVEALFEPEEFFNKKKKIMLLLYGLAIDLPCPGFGSGPRPPQEIPEIIGLWEGNTWFDDGTPGGGFIWLNVTQQYHKGNFVALYNGYECTGTVRQDGVVVWSFGDTNHKDSFSGVMASDQRRITGKWKTTTGTVASEGGFSLDRK